MKGAESGGLTGFAKGVGTGMLGLVVKPVVGVTDAATDVLQGTYDRSVIGRARGGGGCHKVSPTRDNGFSIPVPDWWIWELFCTRVPRRSFSMHLIMFWRIFAEFTYHAPTRGGLRVASKPYFLKAYFLSGYLVVQWFRGMVG